ncbi:hypothetical protein CTheo_2295 [Ceratobasidium theobromae]|uniref:Probable RNA polymerase II nuclear localization protein SLC7A6OS n=1 Tax=Ceratobasidium theobromae TaxID=1582974 RepID=A0A5N5QR82_9AGAM|nr:hypothetical protein CTheo_2295 [Ceratobasidium theobromae]
MPITASDYSRAIFVKRKRVDEPMDALMIDLPSQSKRYRGPGETRGMFTLAETMTEDPSLLDDQKAKDLRKRLELINQEPRASPKVSSPAMMPISPGVPRAVPPAREYKVLRTARTASPAVSAHPASSGLTTTGAPAASRAPIPIPIPIPGQAPPVTSTISTVVDGPESSQSKFVLYEAVLAAPAAEEQPEDTAPEMEEFQDMLQEYLRVNDISLDAPPPRKPVTSASPAALAKKPAIEEEDDEDKRRNSVRDLVVSGPADIHMCLNSTGLPPTEGDILADEEDSDSVKDEADEDSNEEDFYRNDYPDTESDESDVYESDGDHEWR